MMEDRWDKRGDMFWYLTIENGSLTNNKFDMIFLEFNQQKLKGHGGLMEISRFLDASTIFDQSSLWGRHSEVLVIYPESCCILFCWLILANKKVEFDP
jgi:hypothetical protein